MVMDLYLTWLLQYTYPIAVPTEKRREACFHFSRRRKIYHIPVSLNLEIRNICLLNKPLLASCNLISAKELPCWNMFSLFVCLSLYSLKFFYSLAVEWVLIFEFWFEKVGSKQNNIIDCTRYQSTLKICLIVSVIICPYNTFPVLNVMYMYHQPIPPFLFVLQKMMWLISFKVHCLLGLLAFVAYQFLWLTNGIHTSFWRLWTPQMYNLSSSWWYCCENLSLMRSLRLLICCLN